MFKFVMIVTFPLEKKEHIPFRGEQH